MTGSRGGGKGDGPGIGMCSKLVSNVNKIIIIIIIEEIIRYKKETFIF